MAASGSLQLASGFPTTRAPTSLRGVVPRTGSSGAAQPPRVAAITCSGHGARRPRKSAVGAGRRMKRSTNRMTPPSRKSPPAAMCYGSPVPCSQELGLYTRPRLSPRRARVASARRICSVTVTLVSTIAALRESRFTTGCTSRHTRSEAPLRIPHLPARHAVSSRPDTVA